MKPHIYFCFGEWRASLRGFHHAVGETPREAYRHLHWYLYFTKDAVPDLQSSKPAYKT